MLFVNETLPSASCRAPVSDCRLGGECFGLVRILLLLDPVVQGSVVQVPKLTLYPFIRLSVRTGPNLQSYLFQAYISSNPSRVELKYTVHLYINLACLSGCLFVCLYPINVKTGEPIWPKFFVGHHVTTRKVYE